MSYDLTFMNLVKFNDGANVTVLINLILCSFNDTQMFNETINMVMSRAVFPLVSCLGSHDMSAEK